MRDPCLGLGAQLRRRTSQTGINNNQWRIYDVIKGGQIFAGH